MIGPVGHLGARVSALLDGQLSAEEAERAWLHVHGCHTCRDLVEREGWIKTRLAGFAVGPTTDPVVSDRLKGSLLGALPAPSGPALVAAEREHRRRQLGLVAIGGGALGAAVLGVVALGVTPGNGPALDRRAPAGITQTQSPRPSLPTEAQPVRSHAAGHAR